jgi:hypothetical protein
MLLRLQTDLPLCFLPVAVEIFFSWCGSPSGTRPPLWGSSITLRNTTSNRIPLDEWSARRRNLYLTTNNIHKKQTFMPPAGFEHAIPASDSPQTHALRRASTGIGICRNKWARYIFVECFDLPVQVGCWKWHLLNWQATYTGVSIKKQVILFRRNKQLVLPIQW